MSQVTTIIDGIQLKLSNLDKVLWPAAGITKAEFIQYYLSVFDYMKPLIENRPLSLIRFPDGIEGMRFFSKNAPEHTPDWVPLCPIDDISYVMIRHKPELVYLANLAALEIHAMTIRSENVDHPDTMIFDLDPSEDVGFGLVKDTCRDLYVFLQDLGYHPLVKTSGSKGLHIYVPLMPHFTRDQVISSAKAIGTGFGEKNPHTTLKISKEKRVGKILIDIYRNHQSQTCIAPLSTRAKTGCSVSMPILFSHLETLESSDQYTISNALPYLEAHKPWQDYYKCRTSLHDVKQTVPKAAAQVPESLTEYSQKRDFDNTPEPAPTAGQDTGTRRFVIQLHDATNLHYDLRLEENGVLLSWAIPKNIPLEPGLKKLAIRTEDHPVKYLIFEGKIPAGEYGGGTMWIFDSGTYDIIKKDKDSYRFLLHGKVLKGEYLIFHTREDQWLLERTSAGMVTLPSAPSHMLAEENTTVPGNRDHFFELKWDGIRVFVIKSGKEVRILSRSGRDITATFEDIAAVCRDIDAEYTVLDGELVSLDDKGVPVFANIISRMHSKSGKGGFPAVLYLFDLIHLDGNDCTYMSIEKRREWLTAIIKTSDKLRISEAFEDGSTLFEAAKSLGLEGIMAKRKGSTYTQGKRNMSWIKIKVRTIIDAIILGYTKGKGDRSDLFGALHVGKFSPEGKLVYLGKVGTGFDEAGMKSILAVLKDKKTCSKPVPDAIEEEHLTTWIAGGPECEVQYASLTPNGTLREPVFCRLKDPEE